MAFAVLLVGGFSVLAWFAQAGTAAPSTAGGQTPASTGPSGPNWPYALGGTDPQSRHRMRVAQAAARLTQARQTLDGYRQSTRYPYESRPADEQRDQTYPNRPVADTQVLSDADGKSDPAVRIKASQSKVFVASGERVVYTVAATDPDGKPLPLTVTQAIARGIDAKGSSLGTPQAMPMFNDNGTDGDTTASDQTYSTTLTPAQTAFAQFAGTIRLEVSLKVGEHEGIHRFDVIYTPDQPAVWAGAVREAQEDGSLALYLPAQVRVPGRYIVNGRLDDANGKPIALLTFNQELSAGMQQVRLLAFGKLIHDAKPAFPLRLRDVDGYLLKDGGFPDRALMPRLEGPAYATKVYQLASFSDAEWTSEERDRYLAEYGNDVNQAQQELSDAMRAPAA